MAGFNYHANAVAVGGHLMRPASRSITPRACCTLPKSGGDMESRSGPVSFSLGDKFVYSYSSACTTMSGQEASSGIHTTVINTVIRDLNVEEVFKVSEVIFNLTLNYDTATHKVCIDAKGSDYIGLTLAGEELDVDIDYEMSRAASDYAQFRKDHPELPEVDGTTYYSLARNPRLRFDENGNGYLYQENFGRIYFGQWTAAPKTQTLTMLRFRLGSPVEGDLLLGEGQGNGEPIPC